MPNPVVDSFVDEWLSFADLEERKAYAQRTVTGLEGLLEPNELSANLLEIGRRLNSDFTQFLTTSQPPQIAPANPAEIEATLGDLSEKAPWTRRALAGVHGAAEWWQENAVEPVVASVLSATFGVIPGKQDFEIKLQEAAKIVAAENQVDNLADSVRNFAEASARAYRETKTPWGTKGAMELIFDPLNLIGAGLPGKLGRSIPALKGLMTPLNAIDQAPIAIVERAISIPFRGIKVTERMAKIIPELSEQVGKKILPGLADLPGVKKLASPAQATKISEAASRAKALIEGRFGEKLFSESPADTLEILSNLKTYPDAADPVSLHGLFNQIINNTRGLDWEKTMELYTTLKPAEAAELFATQVASAERVALKGSRIKLSPESAVKAKKARKEGRLLELKGGEAIEFGRKKSFTGEELVGSGEGRIKGVASLLDRVGFDRLNANGIALGIDKILARTESVWLNKVEPGLIRPWSVAYLATAGYLPMNFVEDIGVAALGMGVLPFGVNDKMYGAVFAGLPRPRFLDNAEAIASGAIDARLGMFTAQPQKGVLNKVVDVMGGFWVRKSSALSAAMQRSSLTNSFFAEYEKGLRELGFPSTEIDNMRKFMHTELSAELEPIREEFLTQTWMAYSTGREDAVLGVADNFTAAQHIIRTQRELMREFPELAPDVRLAVGGRLKQGQSVTRENVEVVRQEMRDSILEQHRYTPEGIRAELEPLVESLGRRPPRSPDEAMSLLRRLTAVGDRLTELPREIRARYKLLGRQTSPEKRKALWRESLQVIDEGLGDVRKLYTDAMERAKAPISQQLDLISDRTTKRTVGQALDDAFLASKSISDNLDKTWKEYRERVGELFDDPTRTHDRAFWDEVSLTGDEIWNAEKIDRAQFAGQSRTAWNTIFNTVVRGADRVEKPFIRDSLFAQYGETIERLDDFRQDLFKLQEVHRTAPTNAEGQVGTRIERVKGIIRREVIAKRDLEILMQEAGEGRFNKTSILAEFDKEIRTLERERVLLSEHPNLQQPDTAIQERLDALHVERQQTLTNLIPTHRKQEYNSMLQQRTNMQRALSASPNPAMQKQLATLNTRLGEFERVIGQGIGTSEVRQIEGITQGAIEGLSQKLSATPPTNLSDVNAQLATLANAGDEDASTVIGLIANEPESGKDIIQRIFSKSLDLAEAPPLSELQFQTLRDAVLNPDRVPTATASELVDEGFLQQPTILKNGKWRMSPTEKGETILNSQPDRVVDIDAMVADLPEAQQQFNSVVEHHFEQADELLDRMVKASDNPTLPTEVEGKVREFLNKVANDLKGRPDFQAKAEQARQLAAKRANDQFDRWFINYDARSTFDVAMQRVMPFWMYESRRWPRLAKLALRNPVLGKYFAMSAGDWDYGYADVGGGMQASPMRGNAASILRTAFARDTPEYHNDWRGTKEVVVEDWLGRGGFYFNGLISAPLQLASGRIAEAVPPPLQMVLSGITALGGDLPEPFKDLVFSSRFTDGLTDKVLSSEFNVSPESIRLKMSQDDEEAIAIFDMASKEALWRSIFMQQTSVTRYKPKVRVDFLNNTEEAFVEVVGVSQEAIDTAKELGIPLSAVVAVSGPQRKAMRELVPNYDAQIGANFSLRPKEEQEARLRIEEFWDEVEVMRETFQGRLEELSTEFESGRKLGPQYRDELRVIKRDRAVAFSTLKAQTRFRDVPLTVDQRIEWATRNGGVPPMIHPIDEMRERFHAVNPEDKEFLNPFTGGTDWNKFFSTQEAIVREYPPQLQQVFQQVRLSEATPAERALEVATPWLRAYAGIRDNIFEKVQRVDPNAAEVYQQYLQLKFISSQSEDEKQRADFQAAAIAVLSQSPILMLAERQVRAQREILKDQNPEMARVFRMWLSARATIPTR